MKEIEEKKDKKGIDKGREYGYNISCVQF